MAHSFAVHLMCVLGVLAVAMSAASAHKQQQAYPTAAIEEEGVDKAADAASISTAGLKKGGITGVTASLMSRYSSSKPSFGIGGHKHTKHHRAGDHQKHHHQHQHQQHSHTSKPVASPPHYEKQQQQQYQQPPPASNSYDDYPEQEQLSTDYYYSAPTDSPPSDLTVSGAFEVGLDATGMEFGTLNLTSSYVFRVAAVGAAPVTSGALGDTYLEAEQRFNFVDAAIDTVQTSTNMWEVTVEGKLVLDSGAAYTRGRLSPAERRIQVSIPSSTDAEHRVCRYSNYNGETLTGVAGHVTAPIPYTGPIQQLAQAAIEGRPEGVFDFTLTCYIDTSAAAARRQKSTNTKLPHMTIKSEKQVASSA